jgi:hypothetical protein
VGYGEYGEWRALLLLLQQDDDVRLLYYERMKSNDEDLGRFVE